ncbi:sugar ABC transporter substrate-binding protein [Sinomonas sp. JGH33]|uniref:Sugar ABC transporter substrate-binding protein n=1 Tax=Sinomonas terricola TaxID=3110330 RepID=A0ABU5T686_9MICC|nr:sugar ABC transporter substrate-binding protein [Sinomonas sp. JGH33]MEA5455039.1 sugar ABC transporter substrate-binding protein [Sinomonas sp. JGH33]
MLKRRSTLAVGLVVAGAITLSACGRSDDAGAAASAGTISSGKATGTIKVWAQGAEAQNLGEIIKGFQQENPDAKIEITAIPWGSAHDKYQTAIAGGSTPDLAQMGTTWMADFASAFEQVPHGVDASGMFSAANSAATVKGSAVGVPWYVDTRVVYYRKDLAEKAGYSSPPATWDDFKGMAKAMQTKAGATYGMSMPTGAKADDFQSILPFVWSNGANLTDQAGTMWTIDTPEMVGALSYVDSFFSEGIANKNPDSAVGATEAAFVSGKTPIMFGAPSEISGLESAGGAAFSDKIGVMTFPKEKSGTSFVGGSDLAVFKNAANRDGAWKLVQYLARPDVQAQFYKLTGDLPSVQSAWDQGDLKADPRLQVFKAQLNDAKSPPANTSWTQVSSAADSEMEKMVRGGTTPQQAAQELQATASTVGIGQ